MSDYQGDEDDDLAYDPEAGDYRSTLLSGGDQLASLAGGSGGQTQLQSPTPMGPMVSGGGRGDAFAAVLRQIMETGSQNRPLPSNAADLASAQTRVADILMKSLKGMDGTSGLERLGGAAMQTLAGQGKVSLPQSLAAMEQQDVGRAYNIANALAGLSKTQGAGALQPQQIINAFLRKQEGEDRNTRALEAQFSSELTAIARAAQNPGAVFAAARNGLANAGYDKAATPEDKRRIQTQVLQSIAGAPYAQPRATKSEKGEKDTELPGFPMNADGSVNFFATIAKPKSAEERMWNSFSPTERRLQYDRLREKYTTGAEGGGVRLEYPGGSVQIGRQSGNTAERKAVADLQNAQDGFAAASKIIDRMVGILEQQGGSVLGVAGGATQIFNYIKDQVSQVYGGNLPDRLKGSVEDVASRFGSVMSEAGVSSEAPLVKLLSASTSADAARMKTNLVFLTYYVAKILDDKGALSNNDVKMVMGAVGKSSSAADMRAALGEVRSILQNRVKIKEDALAGLSRKQPATPATPPVAPTPQPAPTPAPAAAAPLTRDQIEAKARENARAAIAKGAPVEVVVKRLRDLGFSTEGF